MSNDYTDIPLLDTHQHFIYRDRFGYEWANQITQFESCSFTLADYQSASVGTKIKSTIFMETAVDDDYWRDEARFALRLSEDAESSIVGIIASCRPEKSATLMDDWLDEMSGTKVVGFRRVLHTMPDELCSSKNFIRNIRELGERGKTFDLCALERQLPFITQLVSECPNTSFVLDHCGIPDITLGNFEFWKNEIDKLAHLKNVSCKISGLIAYCPSISNAGPTLKPYITHIIAAFGWDRVCWGGDWPVCNLATGLPEWVSLLRDLLSDETRQHLEKLYYKNALRIYGLNDSVSGKHLS